MPESVIAWIERDVIAAEGPEATAYLQGQVSQDLTAVTVGHSAWSWVLSPAGKVDALVRATRRSEDSWLLDTDHGWGELLLARLARFKLRSKLEMNAWVAQGARVHAGAIDECIQTGDWQRADPWPGLGTADVFGPDLVVRSGTTILDPTRAEVDRILAGLPRMGAELSERTIPAETGLIDRTVSFSKGCYTGQELVARIDSRGGHVPRNLMRLYFDAEVGSGTELTTPDGASAGMVTSAARAAAADWVGLGYVKRGVEVAAGLHAGSGGPAVRVAELLR